MNADRRRREAPPVSAKVVIFEVIERPWGELTTDARVDDRIYVGSAQWRAVQGGPRQATGISSTTRPRAIEKAGHEDRPR